MYNVDEKIQVRFRHYCCGFLSTVYTSFGLKLRMPHLKSFYAKLKFKIPRHCLKSNGPTIDIVVSLVPELFTHLLENSQREQTVVDVPLLNY